RPKVTTSVSSSASARGTVMGAFSSKHWPTRWCGFGAGIMVNEGQSRRAMAHQPEAGLGLKHRDEVHGIDVAFILCAFLRSEEALVAFFGQFSNSVLGGLAGPKIDKGPGYVPRECAGDRFKYLFQDPSSS